MQHSRDQHQHLMSCPASEAPEHGRIIGAASIDPYQGRMLSTLSARAGFEFHQLGWGWIGPGFFSRLSWLLTAWYAASCVGL